MPYKTVILYREMVTTSKRNTTIGGNKAEGKNNRNVDGCLSQA